MIEFEGYINGAAEKCWQRTNKIMGIKLCVFSWLPIGPAIVIWGINLQNWLMVILTSATFFIFPLFALIPQSKKTIVSLLPKNIVIDDEFIICKTNQGGETRLISDVKSVIDHGEFYQFVFPFGKISTNFICQKELLVKGSLKEFEAIFEEKLKTSDGSAT